jgi:hypothetical protein
MNGETLFKRILYNIYNIRDTIRGGNNGKKKQRRS